MRSRSLTEICTIRTGKLDSNAFDNKGIYPFFTCAPEPLRINHYAFDDDVILLAGNNASGNFHCTRYKGKFNAYQRTYVITPNSGYNIDYIYYSLLLQLELLQKQSAGSQTKFLTMKILNGIEIADISLGEQIKISKSLTLIDCQIKRNNDLVQKLQVLALNSFDYFSKDNSSSNSVILRDILIERDKSPLQVNNVVDGTGDIPFFTSGETILYTNECLATGFNIFLSTGGNAKVQSYYGDVSYSTDTWCISAKNNLEFYLYGYLKHIETQMDKLYFHGTGLKHLQKPIFLKSVINILDAAALEKYNAVVQPIYIQISKIEQSTIKLQRLKAKLLPLLINQQLL